MSSIRTKILFGCISLTLVTLFVGFLSRDVQTKLSAKVFGIYDNAFQSMNYLRSAQAILLGISRNMAAGATNKAIFIEQLQSALDALDVARERAMSGRGGDIATELQASMSTLQAHLRETNERPLRKEVQDLEKRFDNAVSIYASDGFRLRLSAEATVSQARLQTYLAMAGSVIITAFITMLLSRAIVPSIHFAVGVATAIAAGKLDNHIDSDGAGETGLLLKALASMQDSIAAKITCIEMLMAQQTSSHDAEIALQNVRFEAALDHMTVGLRMFDATRTLVIQNKRFTEMFETEDAIQLVSINPSPGSSVELGPPRHPALGSSSRYCGLGDGRTIEVSEEPMADGGRVITYEDVTERQRVEANLSYMARHDALTGLPNRVLFREHLVQKLDAEHDSGVLYILCLDLDRFKSVNDTLGHPVGDRLLQETALRLREATLEAGIVARLGGDEFAVIQASLDWKQDAGHLARRLIEAMSLPFEIDGHRILTSTSIGIAAASDGAGSPDELLKNADLALYSAKAAGRSTYHYFEPGMTARVQARRIMEIELRAAMSGRQFELYYQPIVNAKTGAVVCFEALLRWHHPKNGIIGPAEFVPVAEETGLISAIGQWVLQTACADASAWPNDIKVAVNLSPLQFQHRNLTGDVTDALRESGLSPKRLDLEITESLMLQDSDATLSVLHELRALGISISMDDFGTGYSSLSYLRRFPFDKIKIDRSFVSDVAKSSDGLAIVRAVIKLGRSLRMNVVAEGVETLEQQDMLCKAGCQELQGYLFSRPRPASSIRELLKQRAIAQAA